MPLACANTVDIASLRRRLVYALHFIGRLLGMVDADHAALSGGAGRVGIAGAGGSQLSLDAAEGEEPEQEVEDGAHGLLPPRRHIHDYAQVATELARWHAEDGNRLEEMPAGLNNSGNTCFAASALQCMYHTRLFTAYFSAEPHAPEDCQVRGFCVLCEYQAHVKRSLDSEPQSSFSIGKLTSDIRKIAKHFVRGRQEDSSEYIQSLLDGMHVQGLKEVGGEKAEKVFDSRTQETTMVYHIFGGYTSGHVVCGQCGFESRTYQSMLDIPIEVNAKAGGVFV